MDGGDTLAEGRVALVAHRWSDAYDLLTTADKSTPLGPADLVGLADAARWSGHYPEMLGALERAESAFSTAGDHRGAARVALQLAREHFERNEQALASGWYGRAATLLGEDTECGEYALLRMLMGTTLAGAGKFEKARELLTDAAERARRFGDPDTEGLAHIYLGHVLVNLGDEAGGLAMVDEATAAAMSGGLGVHAAGNVYCSTIFLCRNRGDWRRAQEWTEVSLRWCERESVSGFPGLCRFHRAEIKRFRGALDDAERDALDAAQELLAAAPRFAAWAFHELGEIRRRLGNFSGAIEAFRRSSELGFDPQPGLALLRLDEGDVTGAAAAIRRALADERGDAHEARGIVLPAAVTIELASGDLDAARDALTMLEARAAGAGTTAFAAAVAQSRGEVALAEGRTGDAVTELRTACRLWCDIDAPYDAAQARVVLARAFEAQGAVADADLEFDTALATLERLGATKQVRRVAALRQRPEGRVRRVRTFVFTDIVDSTRLVELIGDEAWEDVLRWHDRTLRECFSAHGGQEVKHEGDGFFVAFAEADGALDCARAVQRALADHRRDHGFAPRVRIGVHTAEASERGNDYVGGGVHAAARVAGAAGSGEILASRAVLDGCCEQAAVSDPRSLHLKGLADPVEVASVNW